jgi:hypothetical protein
MTGPLSRDEYVAQRRAERKAAKEEKLREQPIRSIVAHDTSGVPRAIRRAMRIVERGADTRRRRKAAARVRRLQ